MDNNHLGQVKSKRQSNIELLRIIAMVLIIFHHFIVHGVLNYDLPAMTLPFRYIPSNMVSQLIASGGKVGVDLFVIITGYFLVTTTLDSGKMKRRLKSLLGQIWFYSITIFIFNCVTHIIQPNAGMIVKVFLPVCYGTYWFATAYVILYLFVPYINKCLMQLSQKEHLHLLMIMICVISLLPTFLPSSFKLCVNSVSQFILYYVTGAYLRRFPLEWHQWRESWMGFGIFTLSTLAMWGSVIILNLLALLRHSRFIYSNTFYFSSSQSFIIYAMAAGLFIWGKHWRVPSSRFINTVAGTVFGVYLIHDNPFSEEILWQHWLNLPSLIRGDWRHIIIGALIVCPLVFIVCSLIEYLRQIIFKIISKWWHTTANHK